MEPVTLREATRADLPAVLELYRALDRGEGEEGLDLAEGERLFARMGQYPNYHLYVAEAGGEIVGAFALLIMDNLAHAGAPSGVAEDVVVREDRRGQGIGRQMMEFAIGRCREAGCYKLALSSNLKREAAHRFYDSLGFERHGYSFRILLEKGE